MSQVKQAGKKNRSGLTPMMEQYYALKEQYPGTILMFRIGDFYEMFNDDAETAARELDITLTSKPVGNGIRVPLAGVPHHSVTGYIVRLVQKGYRVSLCDQVEDPKVSTGIVKRDVVRLFTPGTLFAAGAEEQSDNAWLCSIYAEGDDGFIAFGDLGEGEIRVLRLDRENLSSELARLRPAEILIPESAQEEAASLLSLVPNVPVTPFPDYHYLPEEADRVLREHFGVPTLSGFGFEPGDKGAVVAAGALLGYFRGTQKGALDHLKRLCTVETGRFMYLDGTTIRNLELFRNIHNNEEEYSLFWAMNQCLTPMGTRTLREFLGNPLISKQQIDSRLDAVSELFERTDIVSELRDLLKSLPDLPRIAARVGMKICTPRGLLQLKNGLRILPRIHHVLSETRSAELARLRDTLDTGLGSLADLIESAIDEDAPASLKDGGVFRKGYNDELDELRGLTHGGKEWISELQKSEREKTGIPSLKVGYNRVFGYYIEVTKAHIDKVPETYIRKQTLVNAERFITPELKEKETLILNAEERCIEIETRLFEEIREEVSGYLRPLQDAGRGVAELDVLASFAVVARDRDYCRPEIVDRKILEITGGRHPVVELLLKKGEFIPNDTRMGTEENGVFHLITGPNMAGKSTAIRQAALITLLAHTGSFVPAVSARVGITDRIFTRVGASDYLAGGLSTFMVEMTETANILNNATERSLVVLDEIGRGTSTYDGVAIAWAVSENIVRSIRCRALFATHFHELAELASRFSEVKNYNISVREWNGEVIFLHKIVPGCADRSYGVHVARLAGIPTDVVEEARKILSRLEEDGKKLSLTGENLQPDLFMFQNEKKNLYRQLENRLLSLDINNLTPLEALRILQEVREEAERISGGQVR